jgi:D-sedoheptulose 7-phosphate isomerase
VVKYPVQVEVVSWSFIAQEIQNMPLQMHFYNLAVRSSVMSSQLMVCEHGAYNASANFYFYIFSWRFKSPQTLFLMKDTILNAIHKSIEVKSLIIKDPAFVEKIYVAANELVACFRRGGKVLFCGNGGSAADAQHLSAELSGRFYYDRPPLNAEALHVNSSYLTAVANDYTFEEIYSRMVLGVGKVGDILIGLSTSGNSKNIVRAFEVANSMGIMTIAITGLSGGELLKIANLVINVPSADTPRIQEAHIMIGHIICQLVESEMFPTK